jgi:hypothetical protein
MNWKPCPWTSNLDLTYELKPAKNSCPIWGVSGTYLSVVLVCVPTKSSQGTSCADFRPTLVPRYLVSAWDTIMIIDSNAKQPLWSLWDRRGW